VGGGGLGSLREGIHVGRGKREKESFGGTEQGGAHSLVWGRTLKAALKEKKATGKGPFFVPKRLEKMQKVTGGTRGERERKKGRSFPRSMEV